MTAFALLVLPWFVIAYIGLVIFALWQSSHWPFSLHAQTRLVEIRLSGNALTQWDVSSAVLCVRKPIEKLREIYQPIAEPSRVAQHCGSRRWYGYTPASSDAFKPELTAKLGGTNQSTRAGFRVRIASIASGRLIVAVQPSAEAQGQPSLSVTDSTQTVLAIPSAVSFVWPTRVPDHTLLFPYTGAIRVGQDVNTVRRQLLETGHISIYSASGEAAGGRALVDSIDLLPGDMVDISDDSPENLPAFARGFVRVTAEEMTRKWPLMEVVAFGLSNRVRIHRFGDAGLDFRPSVWARLTHDNKVVIASLLLFGSLTILAALTQVGLVRRRRCR